jgi:signal transduction protein with GAF and PtsI domain
VEMLTNAPDPALGTDVELASESMFDTVRLIAEEVHAGDTVDAVMDRLVRAVTTHAPWPAAWISIFDEQHRRTLRIFQAGYSQELIDGWTDWPLEEGPAGLAISSGEPVVIPDTRKYPYYAYMAEHGRESDFRAALYVPVPIADLRGVVGFNRRQPHAFTPGEIALARVIASYASLAFRSVLMRDAAVETERSTHAELSRAAERAGHHGRPVLPNLGILRHARRGHRRSYRTPVREGSRERATGCTLISIGRAATQRWRTSPPHRAGR